MKKRRLFAFSELSSLAKMVRAVANAPVSSVAVYEFGASEVKAADLATLAGYGWLERRFARPSDGETTPLPHADEVVVFTGFFKAGLRFPVLPLVTGVLQRFGIQFHQMTPNSFPKFSAFVWGCRSQGVEPTVEGFIKLHRLHTQKRTETVKQDDGRTVIEEAQFGMYTFVKQNSATLPVAAQRNKQTMGGIRSGSTTSWRRVRTWWEISLC